MKQTKLLALMFSLILILSAIGVFGLNIAVTKTAMESQVNNGSIVTFILNVTNSDTVNVTDYWLEDVYNGMYFDFNDEVSISYDYYNETTDTIGWDFNLTVNESFVVEVNFTAIEIGNGTNNASLQNETEHVVSEASETVEILPIATITKTLLTDTAIVDEIVQFKINVTNTGAEDIVNYEIADFFDESPAYMEYTAYEALTSNIHYKENSSGNILWSINVSVGDSIALLVNFTALQSGSTHNDVELQVPPSWDTLVSDSVGFEIIDRIENATLTKTVLNSPVVVGEIAQFMINVTNTGNVDLTEVILGDNYNLTYLNFSEYTALTPGISLDEGETGGDRIEWLVNISVGDSIALIVNFTTLEAGNTTNEVEFKNSTEHEIVYGEDDVEIIPPQYVEILSFEYEGDEYSESNVTLYLGIGDSIDQPEELELFVEVNSSDINSTVVNITHGGKCVGSDPLQMVYNESEGDFEAICMVNKTVVTEGINYLEAEAFVVGTSAEDDENFTIDADFTRPDIHFTWRTITDPDENIPEPHEILANPDFFFSPTDNMIRISVNATDNTEVDYVDAEFDPDFNFSDFPGTTCEHQMELTYNDTLGLWEGNCTLGSSYDINDIEDELGSLVFSTNVVIYAYDEHDNKNNVYNTSIDAICSDSVDCACNSDWSEMDGNGSCQPVFVPLLIHDFGVFESDYECMQLGPLTTNMSTEMDFTNVNLILEVQLNLSCDNEDPSLPDDFMTMVLLNFSSLDFDDENTAEKLASLPDALDVEIPGPNQFGEAYIYVNTSYFAELNATTSITMYHLPFTTEPTIAADADAAGFDNESITWVSGPDPAFGNATTGNLTFDVDGFSGYNMSDTLDPIITAVDPLNDDLFNETVTALQFNVNGTGTQPSIIEVDVNSGTYNYIFNNTQGATGNTLNCTAASQGSDFFLCDQPVNYGEGAYAMDINAYDFGGADPGNYDTLHIEFGVDTTAPVTNNNATPGWHKADFDMKLTATDENGVDYTSYKINDTVWVNYTTPIAITAEGNYSVEYYSVDNAGNKEATKSFNVLLDKTDPGTTDDAPSGWEASPFNVTLSPTDTLSGVAYTYYELDEEFPESGTIISINTTGNHSINYYSVDVAENDEAEITVYAALDMEVPVTTSDILEGWYTAIFNVTLTPADTHSGVDYTTYRINGGSWVNDTIVSITTDGNYTISYYSVDNVGNVESTNTLDVQLDTHDPITGNNAPTGWQDADFNITLTPTDNATGVDSGIDETYYSVDGGTSTEGTIIEITVEGNYSVEYYSNDFAGNQEATTTVEVKLDKAAPVLHSGSIETDVNVGEDINCNTQWNDTTLATDNITCKLYVDGSLEQTISSSDGACNFVYTTTIDDYNSVNLTVEAIDVLNHTANTTDVVNVHLCGYTITSDLTLLENIDNCGEDALVINTPGITLDCADYVVDGESNFKGIYITADNVTVKNCNVTEFEDGIYVYEASGVVIEDNNVFANVAGPKSGIHLEYAVDTIIRNNDIWENIVGITLIVSNGTRIYSNQVHENSQEGIYLDEYSYSTIIYDNTIIDGEDDGIVCQGQETDIYNNKIFNNSGYGIALDDAEHNTTIYTNSIFGNDGWGDEVQVYSEESNATLYKNSKGNYWGHATCPYFTAGTDTEDEEMVDLYPYNADNFGGTWGDVDPYACIPEDSQTVTVDNGTATPDEGTIVTLYLVNATNINSTEVIVDILNATEGGVIPDGTAVFYLNITAETNATSTITFKIHNVTFDDLGASTGRIFVYADHGSGFGAAISTTYLGNDGEFYIFSFETSGYSVFVPAYVPVEEEEEEDDDTGGSTGGTSSLYYSFVEMEDTLEIENMYRKKVKFSIDDVSHHIMVNNINEDSVRFKVLSNVIYPTVNEGETKGLDVSEDGIDDFWITLVSTDSWNHAKVILSKIAPQEAEPAPVEVPEEIVEEVAEEVIEEPAVSEPEPEPVAVPEPVTEEPPAKSKAWIWIVGVIAAIIIIGAVFWQKKKE